MSEKIDKPALECDWCEKPATRLFVRYKDDGETPYCLCCDTHVLGEGLRRTWVERPLDDPIVSVRSKREDVDASKKRLLAWWEEMYDLFELKGEGRHPVSAIETAKAMVLTQDNDDSVQVAVDREIIACIESRLDGPCDCLTKPEPRGRMRDCPTCMFWIEMSDRARLIDVNEFNRRMALLQEAYKKPSKINGAALEAKGYTLDDSSSSGVLYTKDFGDTPDGPAYSIEFFQLHGVDHWLVRTTLLFKTRVLGSLELDVRTMTNSDDDVEVDTVEHIIDRLYRASLV